ncbi:hypothetical protein AAG570_002086 [Ranatra chinensis]|uniref:Uncharacterized protein n=1 Tax=Ranatra chinensis TaxID=642074 RepID=A0ABD0YT00_9HEMI
MLFLDDSKMKNFTSCFKEKKFLVFFFRRLRLNNTGRYQDSFPYLSLCGVERNFIRCDDRPLVYTHIINSPGDGKQLFCYNHAGDVLFNEFCPDKIFMSPQSGRVYHPCQATAGSVGLVRSKLAIELSRNFIFDEGEAKPPTRFTWQGKTYDLDLQWMPAAEGVSTRHVN